MPNGKRDVYLAEIGKRIKNLRVSSGLSQDELAKRCGYTSRSTINKIELGKNDIPQSKIKAIADALNTTPSYIIDGFLIEEHNTSDEEMSVFEIIENKYDKTTSDFFSIYCSLDTEDKAELRGEARQMLKADKYSRKDKRKNA